MCIHHASMEDIVFFVLSRCSSCMLGTCLDSQDGWSIWCIHACYCLYFLIRQHSTLSMSTVPLTCVLKHHVGRQYPTVNMLSCSVASEELQGCCKEVYQGFSRPHRTVMPNSARLVLYHDDKNVRQNGATIDHDHIQKDIVGCMITTGMHV